MGSKTDPCAVLRDGRGELIDFIGSSFLTANHIGFGHVYLLTFSAQGVVRGNHYHKKSTEVFSIVSGSVQIVIENINTGERNELMLTAGSEPHQRILISPQHAHAIKCLTQFAVLASFCTHEYNANEPDKFDYALLK